MCIFLEAVLGFNFSLMVTPDFQLCECNRFACGPRHPRRCCRYCPADHSAACAVRQNNWRWLRSRAGRHFRCQHCDRIACGPRHFRTCCRACPRSHTFACLVRQENMMWIAFCELLRPVLQLWLWWWAELFCFSLADLR